MPIKTVKVYKVLGYPFAVSTEDGEKIFNLLNANLKEEKKIIIDFSDIELIVSTFLNASIGQLYGLYSTQFIQQYLSITNMTNEDLDILKKVTDTAKAYFKDKKGFERAFNKNFPDAS